MNKIDKIFMFRLREDYEDNIYISDFIQPIPVTKKRSKIRVLPFITSVKEIKNMIKDDVLKHYSVLYYSGDIIGFRNYAITEVYEIDYPFLRYKRASISTNVEDFIKNFISHVNNQNLERVSVVIGFYVKNIKNEPLSPLQDAFKNVNTIKFQKKPRSDTFMKNELMINRFKMGNLMYITAHGNYHNVRFFQLPCDLGLKYIVIYGDPGHVQYNREDTIFYNYITNEKHLKYAMEKDYKFVKYSPGDIVPNFMLKWDVETEGPVPNLVNLSTKQRMFATIPNLTLFDFIQNYMEVRKTVKKNPNDILIFLFCQDMALNYRNIVKEMTKNQRKPTQIITRKRKYEFPDWPRSRSKSSSGNIRTKEPEPSKFKRVHMNPTLP